ncbi:ATP-dependent DNA helicase [Mycena chlorophos]|uniref:ATP-dependent DNA helicase n=1 Tax=Mycena chlorophos TaxID=658473 RepID=A0A8H6WJ10_MYCCL|nr:ATP-dependent DNA helicase [Mycena chlorophos]
MLARRTTIDAAGRTLYDRLPLNGSHLGSQELGVTFCEEAADMHGNRTYAYIAPEPAEGEEAPERSRFTTLVLFEVGSAAQGTHFGAAPAKLSSQAFDDNYSKSHRPRIGGRCPTGASEAVANAFQNAQAVLDSIRAKHEEQEQEQGESWDVKEAVLSSTGDPSNVDVIEFCLPPLYMLPATQANTGPRTPAGTPRKRVNKASTTVDLDAPPTESNAEPPVLRHVKDVADRAIGDKYAPSILMDHEGAFFQQEKAYCVQADVRDGLGLIAPNELGEKLDEGTLVIATVALMTYVMPYANPRKDRDGSVKVGRKIYQVQIERLRVLDGGNGAPFVYTPPTIVAPPSPVKRARNTTVDTAFDEFEPEAQAGPSKKKGRRT